ncbi:hypothetical protein M231_05516 [Tremella mesenterica]|uniref:Uncharacterized protein n=1 Tax=Tremella mesenterica TaxID=5217 RepID=A0A4Q1BI19_TREME|nr:hypothetical protein M231_05516 [Tremella mesenterica]
MQPIPNQITFGTRLANLPHMPAEIVSNPLTISVNPLNSLARAAHQTPLFPRIFETAQTIIPQIRAVLPIFDQNLALDPVAKTEVDNILARVDRAAGPLGVHQFGHSDLQKWQFDTYLSNLNEILELKTLQNGMNTGDSANEVRVWDSTSYMNLQNTWVLKRGNVVDKFTPLVAIYVQSDASIPSHIFDRLHSAINRRLITMNEDGQVSLNRQGAEIEFDGPTTTTIIRAIEHMFRRLATLRVRIGILTTYERSLVFFVNRHHIEVSQVFRRNGASPTNPLGSFMPLLTAISLLNIIFYRHDDTWSVKLS